MGFEMLKIRCIVKEPQGKTIAQFITGLKYKIANMVKLQSFTTSEEAINLACTIEW